MNEDTFNIEVRKFLKQLGVTSQREIESAVRRAVEAGRLKREVDGERARPNRGYRPGPPSRGRNRALLRKLPLPVAISGTPRSQDEPR